MVYPALLSLMRTPRLSAVDCTDALADLNGKKNSGFCACAITFQTHSTSVLISVLYLSPSVSPACVMLCSNLHVGKKYVLRMGRQGQDTGKVCKMEHRFTKEPCQYLIYYTNVDKKNQLDVTFCILYFSSNSCSTHYLPTGLDNLPAATAHTNTRL